MDCEGAELGILQMEGPTPLTLQTDTAVHVTVRLAQRQETCVNLLFDQFFIHLFG